ncbi:hypothetical protein V5799_026422 [Amblyomma americanum]|uniref:Uncharacterized protein n=1 Tax=Amblyomma americanum TaxID=6943 RepID=A0AAQ4DIM1_AMBAM
MTSPRYGLPYSMMLADVCGEAREISSILSLVTGGPSGTMHKAAGATGIPNIVPEVPGEYSELEQPNASGYRSSAVLNVSPSAPADEARAGGYAPGALGLEGKCKPGGNGFSMFRYVSGASAGAVRQPSFGPGDPRLVVEPSPVGDGYSSILATSAQAFKPGGLTASPPEDAASAPRQVTKGDAAHLASGGPEQH